MFPKTQPIVFGRERSLQAHCFIELKGGGFYIKFSHIWYRCSERNRQKYRKKKSFYLEEETYSPILVEDCEEVLMSS